VYHVTARGNADQLIFRDDTDRRIFVRELGAVVRDFGWSCWAYCLMGTHYHLLVETARPNLSHGMKQLNGQFARDWHQRHGTSGHVFQGRYFSVLVQRDEHLLHVARYIVLNPVKAGMCARPEDWRWSSHVATCKGHRTEIVDPGGLLAIFGTARGDAREQYRRFVAGLARGYPAEDVGLFCDTEFAGRHLPSKRASNEIPNRYWNPRRPPLTRILEPELAGQAIADAHHVHGYTLTEIAAELGCHRTTVARRMRGHGRHQT
jgi:REP element-mobilizing transposase RayT